MKIAGATVLVTGAAGGIGQVIARKLTDAGADLIVTSRDSEELRTLADDLGARCVPADLADPQQVAELAERCGDVDMLVANAGKPASGELHDYTPEQIDRALDVNLRAAVQLTRALLPDMLERREGHIVFVSSLAGKLAPMRSALYSATKFGLRGFAQGLREDLRPRGVGVSTIFPGFIREAGMFHESGARLPGYIRTKRPEDVADAVITAIERDRSEIDVAPIPLRIGTMLSGLAPEAVAIVQRKLGASELASQFEEGQREKR